MDFFVEQFGKMPPNVMFHFRFLDRRHHALVQCIDKSVGRKRRRTLKRSTIPEIRQVTHSNRAIIGGFRAHSNQQGRLTFVSVIGIYGGSEAFDNEPVQT